MSIPSSSKLEKSESSAMPEDEFSNSIVKVFSEMEKYFDE